ncbi:hypothetical protein [Parerythrobacter lacustris]|uniref:Helix-turn-helix domain-containing protein n=1 Tax=Parerythrobacter lacustris TaxID=2969984 RepID=A0ABT1XS79_9SPHN|nr:hypothetical protein [Parerythrobacter lacustris]MCR2833297.1 hypothetical protein [Parerythrobacter lacustris]
MPRSRPRPTPAHRARRKPPFFLPVPLRTRRDGWTIARQCHFLVQLYLTGSVAAAAGAVGMSRTSAYRLRGRAGAEGFAWAWDRVLTPPGSGPENRPAGRRRPDLRKVTRVVLMGWLETGKVRPVLFRGRVVAIATKPCDIVLFALLRRGGAFRPAPASRDNFTCRRVSEKGGVGVQMSAAPRAPECTGMGQGASGSGGRIDLRAGMSSDAANQPRAIA